MNQKIAKSLRKLTARIAASRHITVERNVIENEKNRKYNFSVVKDNDGNVVHDAETGKPKYIAHFVAHGTLRNDPDTIRGMYRQMKKSVKATGLI